MIGKLRPIILPFIARTRRSKLTQLEWMKMGEPAENLNNVHIPFQSGKKISFFLLSQNLCLSAGCTMKDKIQLW